MAKLRDCEIKYLNKSMNEIRKDDLKKILAADDVVGARETVTPFKGKKGDNRYSNFFRNFQYFYNRFKEVEDSTELVTYADYILDKCQAIAIISYNTEQAIDIFNSLNSKMMPLTDAHILSAKLFEKTPDDSKEDFKANWEKLREEVNGDDEKMSELLNLYMYILRAKDKNEGTTLSSVRSYFTDRSKTILDDSNAFVEALREILNLCNLPEDSPLFDLQNLSKRLNSNFSFFHIPYLFLKKEDSVELKIEYTNVLIKLFTLLETGEDYSSAKIKAKLFKVNASLTTKSTEEIIADLNGHIAREFKKDSISEYLTNNAVKTPLVFLNDTLFAVEKKLPIDFVSASSINIEHIMPNSGRDRDHIRQEAGISTSDEFKEISNYIGNKILLEEKINKGISNAWFVTKKSTTIANKTGYKDSKFPIATALSTYPKDKWGKEDILNASQKAADRITKFIFDPAVKIKNPKPQKDQEEKS